MLKILTHVVYCFQSRQQVRGVYVTVVLHFSWIVYFHAGSDINCMRKTTNKCLTASLPDIPAFQLYYQQNVLLTVSELSLNWTDCFKSLTRWCRILFDLPSLSLMIHNAAVVWFLHWWLAACLSEWVATYVPARLTSSALVGLGTDMKAAIFWQTEAGFKVIKGTETRDRRGEREQLPNLACCSTLGNLLYPRLTFPLYTPSNFHRT